MHHRFSFASRVRFVGFAALFVAACGGSSDDKKPSPGTTTDSTKPPSGTNTDGGSPDSSAPSTPSTPAASACVAATRTLCERACTCSGTSAGGECVIARGTTVVERHDSLTDCQNYYAFIVCGDPKTAAVYDATCSAAIAGSACVSTSEYGNAVDYPVASCPEP